MKINTEVRKSLAEFLRNEGFLEIPPVIISTITDPLFHSTGGAEIEYAGAKFRLTKSMIFHKQLAILAHDKIFSFSPNIRLEPPEMADTGAHLLEFTQLDLEMAYEPRNSVIELAEDMICHVISHVKKNCQEQLDRFGRDLNVPDKPFERITYKEAHDEYGGIYEEVLSQKKKEPFWIIDYPITGREFYDREKPDDPGFLDDMDMIYPEGYGEALSGGSREYRRDRIEKRILRQGLDLDDYHVYLELAEEGLSPSSGFGLGIERLVRYICGLSDLEAITLFPKTPGSVSI